MLKRILLLAAVLALGTGLVLAPNYLPGFGLRVGQQPSSLQLNVKAKNLILVCPGSAYKSGGSSGTKVGVFDRNDQAGVNYSGNLEGGATLRYRELTGITAATSTISGSGHQLGVLFSADAFSLTVQDPAGTLQQGSTLISAQSAQVSTAGGVMGALGASCQRPASQQWFIGANTNTGRESLLLLSNPSATDATVDLQLFGDQGAIDGSGLTGISVPANRTTVLPLAGFAPNNGVLAVHVQSKGADIAAWIQQRTVRGTVSAGADLISPSILASNLQVIPGLLKRGSADAAKLIAANNDYSDLTPSIAVYVPGSQTATITAQVIGTDSKTFGTVVQQRVSGGSAASIALTGLADGNYNVFISSDQPVISASLLSRTNAANTPITDFAWLPAAATDTLARVLPVSSSAVSKISIANPNNQNVTATVTNLTTGAVQSISVPKQSGAIYTPAPGSVIQVTSGSPLAETLVADYNGQIIAVPFNDYANVGGTLSVLIH